MKGVVIPNAPKRDAAIRNSVMKDVIIIPAYNEGKTIAQVIQKTKKIIPQIIVIDDGSQDDTFTQAKGAGALALRHKVNLGKGAALKTGCDYAIEQGAQKIVVMDADGQHDPKEIPHFMKALDDHAIVFGSRQVPKTMPLVLRFGNTVITRTLRLLYGIDVNDTQCGYRGFTASAYQQLRWNALDYYVETEMIIKAGKTKLSSTQIPIETIYADRYKGTTVIDGVKIVIKMMSGRISK